MAGELVLLTGGTGFLGFHTLVDLLKSGYAVRAAIRRPEQADKLRAAPSIRALAPTPALLSFVIVPDMTAPGAYDEAVKGVQYIVHTASPIPNFGAEPLPPAQLEDYFVKTAVASELGMLRAAHEKAGGTVRRIVITSSTVANVPFDVYIGKQSFPVGHVATPQDRITPPSGPFEFEFQAYSAGKAAALEASEAFVRDQATAFDLVSILPSWIFGHSELITDAANMRSGSTDSVLLGVLLGEKNDSPYSGNAVLGTDAAAAHVRALRPEVKGNQSFVANTNIVWEDAIAIAKKHFPEAFADGRLKEGGKQPTMPMEWDTSKSENILGIKFAPFEQMVKEVAGQYLELLAKA